MRSRPITSILFPVLLLTTALVHAQQIPLDSNSTITPPTIRVTADGEHVITHVSTPTITPYLPQHPTGTAVLVIPGGGHSEIWFDHEGSNVAAYLQARGITAFVLQYRLAREKGSTYTVDGTELSDVQHALRLIRSRAAEWHLNPAHLGVMGFSAGGELAELASTRPDPTDPNTRPAFQALLYPGLPADLRLTAQTPPAFLACGADDRPAISDAVPQLYLALHALHVPAELHVYAGTGHGFGMRWSNPPALSGWLGLFVDWLRTESLL